jgi:hypothetical protein
LGALAGVYLHMTFNQYLNQMKTQLDKTICDLWNISRVALAGGDCSRHSRMIYIKNELARTYPHLISGMTGKQIWFAIEDQMN